MIDQYTDHILLALCDKYGAKVLFWRMKFIGLLPEVAKRRLYQKSGCLSIFEFAKKKAGLSEEQVRRVLNLNQRFEDKPVLKKLLVEGEVSVNKLARIASVATTENQEFWAEQVKLLPNRSLETLVRDEKIVEQSNPELKESVHVHREVSADQLELSDEVRQRLFELKRAGHDINQIIGELLDKRETEISEEKQQVAREYEKEAASRHIPAKVRRVLKAEFGIKCAIPNCNKHSTTVHHTARFSLSKSHNPYFLAPLCKEHHDIAHAIDGRFLEEKSSSISTFR